MRVFVVKIVCFQILLSFQDHLSFHVPPFNYTTSKKILYFTPRYGVRDWGIGEGNAPFETQVCRVQNCYLTSNRDLLGSNSIDKFDALLFHLSGIQENVLKNLPKRKSHQRYIFSSSAPPVTDKYARQDKMRYIFKMYIFIEQKYWYLISNQEYLQLDNDIPKYKYFSTCNSKSSKLGHR